MIHPRRFNFALLALAIVLAQWAGMVHRVEHHVGIEPVSPEQSSSLLHDCLLFDALTTAQTPICDGDLRAGAAQLWQIGTITPAPIAGTFEPHIHRVRVRDPPTLS